MGRLDAGDLTVQSIRICLRVLATALFFGVAAPTHAQTSTAEDPSEAIEREALLGRIAQLERALHDLKQQVESAQEAGAVTPALDATTSPRLVNERADVGHDVHATPPNSVGDHTEWATPYSPPGAPALTLRGFGSVNFARFKTPGAFGLGQFDLFATSLLSDRARVISELVIESDSKNVLRPDLERIIFQYEVDPRLRLEAGRFHSTVGFFNTAFHHGTWFQVATDRPQLFTGEDSGGLLPMHTVGLSVSGRLGTGAGLGYAFEVGNGRAWGVKDVETVQNAVDSNARKSINAAFTSQPSHVAGLQLGASFYFDDVSVGNAPVSEMISATHIVIQRPSLEWLTELVWVRHATAGGAPTLTTGFYSQVSPAFRKVRPYARVEYLEIPSADAMYTSPGITKTGTVGIRVELAPFAALKQQYSRRTGPGSVVSNRFQSQVAFVF